MIIADLFVNLGVKGADKTVGALQGVEGGMKNIASMSLEAKAAILGAMYALEQMFAKSGAAGTSLVNFSAATGVSTKTLQQYQYAARQMGLSNEETASTFKTLQDSMSKIRLGQGAPAGFGQLAMATGGISMKDVEKFMEHPELLLQRLQQFAQKEKRVGIRNQVLGSFGVGEGMTAALARGGFNQKALNQAPVYSEGSLRALDQANIMWKNLGNSIEMAVGGFNASHGGQIVSFFTKIVDMGLKLLGVILKIIDKLHLFQALGVIIDLIVKGFDIALKHLTQFIDEFSKFAEKNKLLERFKELIAYIEQGLHTLLDIIREDSKAFADFLEKNKVLERMKEILADIIEFSKTLLASFVKLGSVISDFFEKNKVFERLKDFLVDVKNIVSEVITYFKTLFDQVSAFADKVPIFENLKNIFVSIVGILSDLGKIFLEVISQGSSFISTLFSAGEAAAKVGDKLHVFEAFGKALSDTFGAIATVVKGVESILDKIVGLMAPKAPEDRGKEAVSAMSGLPGLFSGSIFKSITDHVLGRHANPRERVPARAVAAAAGAGDANASAPALAPNLSFRPNLRLVPPPSPLLQGAGNATPTLRAPENRATSQNIEVNQNLNFSHEGKNSKQTGDSVKQAVKQAFRQLPSQVQGS